MSEPLSFSRLEKALDEVDASLISVNRKDAAQTIIEFIHEKHIDAVSISLDPFLSEIGLIEKLRDKDILMVKPPAAGGKGNDHEGWKRELAATDAGICRAAGIAQETRTMLLLAGVPDERLISLLPPLHVALVRASDVADTIGDLFVKWQEMGTAAGNVVLVTGPSRTADIEKELVLGVHGPRELYVFLISDA